MRKILILMILLSGINIYAQIAVRPRLFIKMGIKLDKYNGGVSNYLVKEEEFITGAFEIGKNNALWFADKFLHNSFLSYPSDYYLNKLKNLQFKLSDEELRNAREREYSWDLSGFIKRRADYSFALMDQKITGDSINICCKYIIMKRIKELGDFKYQYEESYHEIFLKVPLNKEIDLKFLSEIDYQLSVTAIFKIVDWEEKKAEAVKANKVIIDLENYIDINKTISASMDSSKLSKTNLKMGMEYIRTDKAGKEILAKSLDYPLKGSNLVTTKTEFYEIPVKIYKGLISLPFIVYDSHKQSIISRSPFLSSLKYHYSILVIPLNNKGDVYTFDVFIPRETVGEDSYYYKKQIQLKVGENIRIELKQGHWGQSAIEQNERIHISGDEDYYKYINEYYLLSLENDK